MCRIPGRSGGLLRLALTAAVLVTGACSPEPDPAAPQPPTPPAVALSFLQYRHEEGTPRVLLRVTNNEQRALSATGIGLEWPGYGGRFRQDQDATIAPGQTLDLQMRLPPPTCSKRSGPAYGLVELEGATVRSRLDGFGQAIVNQVWERACDERYVQERVVVRVDDAWRRAGSGDSASLVGHLDLVRRTGRQDIRLVGVRGSVMFELGLLRPSVLRGGSDSASFPVRLRPLRCDEHALGQSSQTFEWQGTLRFHDSRARSVSLGPGLRTQVRANALLEQVCG